MAIPSSPAFTYDVFLSFRGEDTRYDFTGNLYKALCDRGIHTFIDHEKLQSGEEITPALLKAIEDSRIAVVVLSQNYASSSFCLDELVTILVCKNKGQLVIPVFYKVDPSDVRHQRGSYEEALTKRQRRFEDLEKVQKWEAALRQVANLSGYHFKERDEYQYEFIERIVERVSTEINRDPLYVADHPVGLLSQVLRVKKLLDVGSDDVHMIGIHGVGGLGKTTLSVAVYNLIAGDFDSSCFLQNVREESNKHGLKHLQTILLSNILGEKYVNLASVHQGVSLIQQRLRRMKVLLILDDVDNQKQLQAFAGSPNWFGPGSRVIITTRDTQLLASHQVKRKYEVQTLNKRNALQLLTWKAFKKEQVDPSYVEVLNDVVTYASGLPLALEVIGSNLAGKCVEHWKSAINQYKRIPKNEIIEILKVSFEALEREEKSIFLDIACCFKGYELREVEDILGAIYDDCMKHHIGVLVDKSLIKIVHGGVEIHDLIEEMGRQIDRQKSPEGSGKRRRISLPVNIIQFLKENTETSMIEILCLDISKSKKEETLYWNGNAFGNMINLKALIIRNCKFSIGPNCFPESLRALEWHGYPSNYLPSNFDPNKLVICKLPHSPFMSFGFHGSSKKFENLTDLNFDKCKLLTQIPDISDLPNLEKLSFESCESLIAVDDSVGFMTKLKILSSQRCKKLRRFPPLNLPSLEKLELSYCSSLENFPEILGKMGNIMRLKLYDLSIKELPVSFKNLTGLRQVYMESYFDELNSSVLTPELTEFSVLESKEWKWINSKDGEEEVGSTVSSNLRRFEFESCNLNDDFFSAGFTQLSKVTCLQLCKANITFLPECMKEFHQLDELDVSYCKYLQEIRGIPPKLRKFWARECTSLTSSSLSMLLDQQLQDARETDFIFPGGSIGSWSDKQSRGPSISFWFRNKFPTKVLCLLVFVVQQPEYLGFVRPNVSINGKCQRFPSFFKLKREEGIVELDHVELFDLRRVTGFDPMEFPLEEEWNHVKVTYEGSCRRLLDNILIKHCTLFDNSHIKAMGIQVLKEESRSMEDIRYDNPYTTTQV